VGEAEEGPAALRRTGQTQPRDVRRQRRIQPWSLIPDCYELRCEGKVIGGFGTDLWKLRPLRYSTTCYSTHGTVHVEWLRERGARVAEALGTPAAGLRPRPAREKGFPSNLSLD
jgi:hypothetical protein